MSELIAEQVVKQYTGLQLKGLELLGTGISPVVVATTLGITESAVSQWLSDQEFASQVTGRRFANMQKHTARDAKWDELEDQLLAKMQDIIPFMMKPFEIIRALQMVNAAKRRGPSAPENTHIANTVVNLSIPVQIVQRFTKNADNQVIEMAEEVQAVTPAKPKAQALITIDSSSLLSLNAARKGIPNDATNSQGTATVTEDR